MNLEATHIADKEIARAHGRLLAAEERTRLASRHAHLAWDRGCAEACSLLAVLVGQPTVEARHSPRG